MYKHENGKLLFLGVGATKRPLSLAMVTSRTCLSIYSALLRRHNSAFKSKDVLKHTNMLQRDSSFGQLQVFWKWRLYGPPIDLIGSIHVIMHVYGYLLQFSSSLTSKIVLRSLGCAKFGGGAACAWSAPNFGQIIDFGLHPHRI